MTSSTYAMLFGGPIDPQLKRMVAVSALAHLTLMLMVFLLFRNATLDIQDTPPIEVTIVELKEIPAFKSERGGGGGGAPAPARAPKAEAPKPAAPAKRAPRVVSPRPRAPKVVARATPAPPKPIVKEEPKLVPKEISRPRTFAIEPTKVPQPPTELERLARAGAPEQSPEIVRGAGTSASDIAVDTGGGTGVRGPAGPISVPGGTGSGSGTGTGSGFGSGAGSGSGSGVGSGMGSGVGAGRGDGLLGYQADPDFTEYLEKIKRRMHEVWIFPNGVSGRQWVVLRFTLNAGARPNSISVRNSSNSLLNDSAIDAMRRASPFPPIPDKFRALIGRPLAMRIEVSIREANP
jgi:TonB family protein